jgi:hypothetical protein
MRENHYEREETFLTNYFILIIMSLCPTLIPFMFFIPNFTKLFFSSFKLFLRVQFVLFLQKFCKKHPIVYHITHITSQYSSAFTPILPPIHPHFSHLNTMGLFRWLKGEPKNVDFAWFLG